MGKKNQHASSEKHAQSGINNSSDIKLWAENKIHWPMLILTMEMVQKYTQIMHDLAKRDS